MAEVYEGLITNNSDSSLCLHLRIVSLVSTAQRPQSCSKHALITLQMFMQYHYTSVGLYQPS